MAACAATLLLVQAGQSPPVQPADDWRQVWPPSGMRLWLEKPESELVRLAENGDRTAQFVLWKKWQRSRPQDSSTMLESSVTAGFLPALYEKGFSMFSAYNYPRPLRLEGWSLMEKAAAGGYLKARIEVANYDSGQLQAGPPNDEFPLLKPNLNRALEYFRAGAQAGHPDSMVDLALLLSSGIGEPRDEKETPHNLLVAAAKLGNVDAMRHLSDRYAYGHGERVDAIEAARWRCSAWREEDSERFDWLDERGNARRQTNLLLDDVAETLSLFVKAVEWNDARAEADLARRLRAAGRNPATELRELRSGSMPGSANK